MKIYCSCSGDCSDKAKSCFEKITERGCSVITDDVSALLKCDALFIYLDGKDHTSVKEDLNLFLDQHKQVAYVSTDNAVLDRGLEMQLGLALRISEERCEEELDSWLLQTELIRKKSIIHRLFITCGLILMAAVMLCAGAMVVKKLADRSRKPETDIVKNEYFDTGSAHTLLKLDLSGKDIEDITFITDAVNLEELDLSNNRIVDISALSGLKSIKKLNLSGNRIKDLSPLSQLDRLEEVDLSDNDISDINVLLALDGLKTLDISGNDITDATVLDYMSGVEIIYK